MGPDPGLSDAGRALAILVVEDNRELRERICADLRARGCRVVGTPNGVEGLEAVVLDQFDVVVTDVEMLPRGGLWLWREVTTLRPELTGRFVFCSSDLPHDPVDGSWRGERLLRKPLEAEALWGEILAVTGPRAPGPSER
jgi:CheY-like chemotaxis protein